MKKKILGIFGCLLFLVLLITPALASPTKGNKVAVTVTMVRTNGPGPGTPLSDNRFTGPVIHLHRLQTFDVTITFEDASTLEGTIDIERKIVNVKGSRIILTDYYVFTFDSEGGGFEGNGQVLLDLVNGLSLAYGMYHGTGAFEGQTLNIGHGWESYVSAVNPWYGYWLKCSVYP